MELGQKNRPLSGLSDDRSNKDTGAASVISIVATVNGAELSVNGSQKMSYRVATSLFEPQAPSPV